VRVLLVCGAGLGGYQSGNAGYSTFSVQAPIVSQPNAAAAQNAAPTRLQVCYMLMLFVFVTFWVASPQDNTDRDRYGQAPICTLGLQAPSLPGLTIQHG